MSEVAAAKEQYLLQGSLEVLPPEAVGSGHIAILWCSPDAGVQVGIPLSRKEAMQVRVALRRAVDRARGRS